MATPGTEQPSSGGPQARQKSPEECFSYRFLGSTLETDSTGPRVGPRQLFLRSSSGDSDKGG